MRSSGSARGDLLLLGGIVLVLVLATFLPPDTSLAEMKRGGVVRACVPVSYPPLVTGDPSRPGIEVELLQAVAEEIGVRLSLNRITAMGRDFNPRNWRITRAQCQIIAGGVVASPSTRTYLETTSSYLSTGWALLAPVGFETLEGATVGFYSGTSGLDRIALSRYLRERGVRPVTVSTVGELVSGLHDGSFDAAVSEALLVRQLAGDYGWTAHWLPEELGRYPLALGLWKGDLTLKRAVESVLATMRTSGELAAVLRRYELAPIAALSH